MIVPCFMAMPRCLRWPFTVSSMKSCDAVDLLSEFMFLKQVAEGHDRGLIWDAVGDWVDTSKTSLGG